MQVVLITNDHQFIMNTFYAMKQYSFYKILKQSKNAEA